MTDPPPRVGGPVRLRARARAGGSRGVHPGSGASTQARAGRTGRHVRPGGGALRTVAAALCALALLTGCAAAEDDPADGVEAGYVSGDGSIETWPAEERGAPVELAGTTYDEEQIDLADWRGDVVVVNFWYAACPPCRAEAPDLAAVATDYADQDVHLLGVNHTDDAGTALAFERSFEVPYPSLNDTDAEGVAAMQGVVPLRAMPSTVVLDQEGRVSGRIIGQVQPGTLRALIDDTLAEEV
ncbi:TlpA family protein disulfide reductase [Ruania zhangjianzhongii]|uniref:TlpA family protein disulfide reductase n=1 Tax=Ruania zhangjianzhongii TaxID=2603206 RepID=UPI001FD41BD1|nr:TlpA disulfide reductase family protein [Ruania zhangjianzhongii]